MPMSARVTNMNGQIVAEKRGGQHRVITADPLGNVIDVRDSSDSQLASYNYWPYGVVRTSTGSIANPWRFCGVWGYYFDGSDCYVRARTYRQQLTRWLTVDPLWPRELPFGYTEANPVVSTDATGLLCQRTKFRSRSWKITCMTDNHNMVIPGKSFGPIKENDRKDPGNRFWH